MNFHLKAQQVKVENLQRIILTNTKKMKLLADCIKFVADEISYHVSMMPDPVPRRRAHWTARKYE